MVNFKSIAAAIMGVGLASGSAMVPEKRAERKAEIANLIHTTASAAEIAGAEWTIVGYCRDGDFTGPCYDQFVPFYTCTKVVNDFRYHVSSVVNFHPKTSSCRWFANDNCNRDNIVTNYNANLNLVFYPGASSSPYTWNNKIQSFLCVGRKPEKPEESKWDDYKGDHEGWESE